MPTTVAPIWMWLVFAVFVVIAIGIDLVAMEKKDARAVSMRDAMAWSLLWITLAMVFNGLLWFWLDHSVGRTEANLKATQFFTGYLIEKALSVDNIFVFLMIFNAFGVPPSAQKRGLIIGVIGAIILRVVMILVGAWLISQFSWLMYVFGAFLVFTGIKMLVASEHEPDLEKNPVLRWMRGHLSITTEFHRDRLWQIIDGKRWYTPLFVVCVLIGITDVIFAVDSIPAIFAITTDPFIVMSSNIFAVLGLRALYFLLAGMAERFHLLSYGLAIVLAFIGAKMLLADIYHVPIGLALMVVALIIGCGILASLMIPPKEKHH